MQEWLKVYFLVGIAYMVWLLLVTIVFKAKKNYIDPMKGKHVHELAFFMGVLASHIITAFLWPLVIMWRVIEYEYLDQKTLFYEEQYVRLRDELKQIGLLKDDKED